MPRAIYLPRLYLGYLSQVMLDLCSEGGEVVVHTLSKRKQQKARLARQAREDPRGPERTRDDTTATSRQAAYRLG